MRVPRLAIAAPASGSGKTTVTLGLLRALVRRGMEPAAFKCGPDYIDTQFHRVASGRPACNLDLFFVDAPRLRSLLARGSQGCDVAVIEGAMGYFDGVGSSWRGSTYDVARATGTPCVLVMDARGSSLTLAAVAQGMARFRDDSTLAGVILSRCSPAQAARVAPQIERASGLEVLGCLPADPALALPSRHLGLVCADEVAGVDDAIERAAGALERTVDVGALLRIARGAADIAEEPFSTPPQAGAGEPVVVAVARDEAFCFYYEENLRMLRDLGARTVEFSPLRDAGLPAAASALYLGGGYPELHCEGLAANGRMRAAVRAALGAGMPCVSECGGFMYLQRALVDGAGRAWPMAGALPGESRDAGRLSHFGYVELTCARDGLYGPAGTRLRAHEFHYWHSDDEGSDAVATKPGSEPGSGWQCVRTTPSLFAGFPHAYWPADPELARRCVDAARRWRDGRAPRRVAAGGDAARPAGRGRSR